MNATVKNRNIFVIHLLTVHIVWTNAFVKTEPNNFQVSVFIENKGTEVDKNILLIFSVFSDYKCFRCLDRSKIIPASQLCDGIVQCQDLSDECLCQTKKGDKLLAICNDICWGESLKT